MLTLCRSGSLPIGHCLSSDNCKEKKTITGSRKFLGLISQQSRFPVEELAGGSREQEDQLQSRTYGKSVVVSMLNSSLRADWFQPPVQNYLDKLPTLLIVSSSKFATRKSCLHCATRELAKRFTVEEPREESKIRRHLCSFWSLLSIQYHL